MTKQPIRLHIPLLLLVTLVVCACAFFGFKRLTIDTDIVRSLPAHEQGIADALEIFRNHPMHDQVAVDIGLDRPAPDVLVACSAFVRQRMVASSLFSEIGMEDIGLLLPELARQAARSLPLLLTGEELEHKVAPRLSASFIHQRLQHLLQGMGGMESIGQTALLRSDPLGLKDLVLARLAQLAPSPQSRLYKGNLISADGRHLLLVARPHTAGTDTAFAAQLAEFFAATARDLDTLDAANGYQVTLTPVGAYRAALDNEEIIRHDVRWALFLSTMGIALLLLAAFPRPLLGLLSLVPALAGTAMALFAYSLFHPSISIMVLGFGGALISITVDHGIAYLLFLDRPETSRGKEAAHTVRHIGGGMAMLTSTVAFLLLSLSDFPVFTELGQFTALGFLFTYLFIHLVFPRILPDLPAATTRRPLLHRLLNRFSATGTTGLVLALLAMLVLLGFAKPEFRVNLSDMNTVSERTMAADHHFAQTWGDIGSKIYLMITASTPTALQNSNDQVLARVEKAIGSGQISEAFVPSMLFPGPERSRKNFRAWSRFWSAERRSQIEAILQGEGAKLGLTDDAFAPFMALTRQDGPAPLPLSSRYYKLLGISVNRTHQLVQCITLAPGAAYDPAAFHKAFQTEGKIFDPKDFAGRLGHLLFTTFATLLGLLALAIALLLALQLLSWRLTALTLLPPLFAFICTLGTLHLIGHPLDIPGLMLSIVILGMGVDYAIYTVRGCQWYGGIDHPDNVLVHSIVFLAGSSTLIGFGVLCGAEHNLLRSVGIVSLLGIFYSLAGTFLLLPPLLRRFFQDGEHRLDASRPIEARIRFRYRLLEAYPRMFVRYKLKLDPLFRELDCLLAKHQPLNSILDIGCGYGVPACWCLERWPHIRLWGVDPNPERIRVAARALGKQGEMRVGGAPDLPAMATPVDAVLLLDMAHYLSETDLRMTLQAVRERLAPGGIVVLRFVTRPEGRKSLYWYVEEYRLRIAGQRACYRSPETMIRLLQACGFIVDEQTPSANSELFWLVGRKQGES